MNHCWQPHRYTWHAISFTSARYGTACPRRSRFWPYSFVITPQTVVLQHVLGFLPKLQDKAEGQRRYALMELRRRSVASDPARIKFFARYALLLTSMYDIYYAASTFTSTILLRSKIAWSRSWSRLQSSADFVSLDVGLFRQYFSTREDNCRLGSISTLEVRALAALAACAYSFFGLPSFRLTRRCSRIGNMASLTTFTDHFLRDVSGL